MKAAALTSATFYRPVTPNDLMTVRTIVDHATYRDGEPPLSEHKAVRIGGSSDSKAVVGLIGRDVVGYAQAAWHRAVSTGEPGYWAIEVVLGDGLLQPAEVAGLLDAAVGRLSAGTVRLWAPTRHVAEAALAMGCREVRRLIRMKLDRLEGRDMPPPVEGVRIDVFEPGRDDAAWLEVNNAAFAGHPENGALTIADLAERLSQPWFNGAGFFVAREGSTMVGFCWTKVHDDGAGEIYVIAVKPDATKRGLGHWLLSTGLGHLFDNRKVPAVILYTEGDNEQATRLYRHAGFDVDHVVFQYELCGP